jgi:hypothetical protein
MTERDDPGGAVESSTSPAPAATTASSGTTPLRSAARPSAGRAGHQQRRRPDPAHRGQRPATQLAAAHVPLLGEKFAGTPYAEYFLTSESLKRTYPDCRFRRSPAAPREGARETPPLSLRGKCDSAGPTDPAIELDELRARRSTTCRLLLRQPEQSSEQSAPVQLVLVHSGRLGLDLRDARNEAEAAAR